MNYYQDTSDYIAGYNPIISDTRIPEEYQDDTLDDTLDDRELDGGDDYPWMSIDPGDKQS